MTPPCTIESMASLPNLFLAAQRARRGKSRKPDVEEWWMKRGLNVGRLRESLLSGQWLPAGYRFFEIFEPKRRVIAAAPFEDRVVHHALCNILAPALERRFIARSYSCQRGKGTTAARETCRRLVNRHAYVLKCDIQKFFPIIDHGILFGKLEPYLPCPGVKALAGSILSSYQTGPDIPAPVFAGDEAPGAAPRPRGLPIGNLTSQLWANFFLDEFDHWITETEQHGDYLRYTDDFLLFGDDKARLNALKAAITLKLAEIRLRLAEPKSRLLATREGVPFCGFRFLPGLRPRVLGATKRRFEKRRAKLHREGDCRALSRSVFSWYQFSREGNSEGLRKAYCQWPLDPGLKRRRRRTRRSAARRVVEQ